MKHTTLQRRDFLRISTTSAALLSLCPILSGCAPEVASISAQSPTAKQPNILFLYLDDLGYGDVGFLNAKSKIPTPNIDRLAKAGMSFTDAHTAAAICGPSRYGLMTGRYPWRTGQFGNGTTFANLWIEPGRKTLASLLKAKGYNTGQIGKWGIRHNYADALKTGVKISNKLTKDNFDFPDKRLLGANRVGFAYAWHLTHLSANKNAKYAFENGLPVDAKLNFYDPHRWLPDSAKKVVEYIEACGGKGGNPKFNLDRNKPFFLYWDPPSPHEPIVPNKEFRGKSKAGPYGDFVIEIDHYIGQILDTLDRMKLADNTLVIFSSDNGPEQICYPRAQKYDHYSMGKLRGVKRDLFEGGHRVPLLVRWPGVVKPNTTSGALVCLTDWLATFAAITHQPLPNTAGEDSFNLLPLLQGQPPKAPARSSILHHTHTRKFAIRDTQWLYIDNKTGQCSREPEWFRKHRNVKAHKFPGELFDLKADPQQTINLYAKHPEIVKAMAAKLKAQRKAGRTAPPRK